MPESVVAVVVTYNRSQLLLECLNALLQQTAPVHRIVLVDNASSDDTIEKLRRAGYMDNPTIEYTRLPTNTGGAGGFHEGIQRAMRLGADWVWVMDDDAEPHTDALEQMRLGFDDPEAAAVAGLAIGVDGQPQLDHRGWLSLCGVTPRAHRPLTPESLIQITRISFASFVGLAVRRGTIERIGLPKKELFIKGDDLEYCVRIAAVGPVVLVPDSRIRHKDGYNVNLQQERRFGMSSHRIPLNKLWLNYFSVRNLIWMRRQNCGSAVAAIYSVRTLARCAVGILAFDTDRGTRLYFYWSAIRDAWCNVFDNDKPRVLTRLKPLSAVN